MRNDRYRVSERTWHARAAAARSKCTCNCASRHVSFFLRDLEAAEEAARFALGAADEFVPFIVEAIQHLAHIKSLRGAPVVAARLIGYNDRRLELEGLQRDAFEQKSHEALMVSVDSQLYRSDTLAHHADGEKMSLDDAVTEALAP